MGRVSKGIGRAVLLPLLLLNLALAIVIIGLAGHYLDQYVSGTLKAGNGATLIFIILTLIGVAVAVAAILTGLHHLRVWNTESGGAALGTAWAGWLLLILAFVVAWKELHLGGNRPAKLKTLEAFVIILTVTHFIYTFLLHLGDRGTSHGTSKSADSNAATV